MTEDLIIFEIKGEDDTRRMCEILAMNGYQVKAEFIDHYSLLYRITVQPKETK